MGERKLHARGSPLPVSVPPGGIIFSDEKSSKTDAPHRWGIGSPRWARPCGGAGGDSYLNRITPPPLPSSGMYAGHAPQTDPRRPAPTWRAHATDRSYGRRGNSARVHAAMLKRLLKAPAAMTGRVARVTVTDAPPQHELAGAQARTWPRPCARSHACTRARGGRVYSRGYGGTATRMHARGGRRRLGVVVWQPKTRVSHKKYIWAAV